MVLSFPGSFQAGEDSWPHPGTQCLPGRLEGLQGLRCPSLGNPSATAEPGLGGASAEFSGSPGLPILQPLPLSSHTVGDSLSPLVSLVSLTASLSGSCLDTGSFRLLTPLPSPHLLVGSTWRDLSLNEYKLPFFLLHLYRRHFVENV